MATPAARPDAMRRHNLSVLLSEVHHYGALTRAELTARLGLSRSTIGALVADLAELGLVQELVPSGGPRAGRPSHVVGPHPSGPFVIAVDVEISHLTIAALGLGGTTLARKVVPLGRDVDHTPEAVAHRIAEVTRPLLRRAGLRGNPVCLGVSVPGTVDRSQGTVGVAPNLGWRNTQFRSILARLALPGVPVIVGNDADLAVVAERLRGGARGCEELVFLMGRTGVGAGIIANGMPLRGHDGHAGEIGHNVVDTDGPLCHCGKTGCLEAYVGDKALLELAGRSPGESTDTVFDAAREGEPKALDAVRRVATSLGRAVAGLVNTLNPEMVMLGGSLAKVFDAAPDAVRQALAEYVLNAPGESVLLRKAELGTDSALVGAAEIAFEGLLADPVGTRILAAR